jgi:hypothetical protein
MGFTVNGNHDDFIRVITAKRFSDIYNSSLLRYNNHANPEGRKGFMTIPDDMAISNASLFERTHYPDEP